MRENQSFLRRVLTELAGPEGRAKATIIELQKRLDAVRDVVNDRDDETALLVRRALDE